jgi:antitoxin YqcF
MPNLSSANKQIAKIVAKAFGGTPRVTRFRDENDQNFVDVLSCSDRPQRGVTSFGTVGLSGHPLYRNGLEYKARVEFVGACGSGFGGFDNALASAAFCVINSKSFCFPGAIFPGTISAHGCSQTLEHFLFVSPYLWEKELEATSIEAKTVAWLLAVPISEAERKYAEEHGAQELEKMLEREQIDIFNLSRPSVV